MNQVNVKFGWDNAFYAVLVRSCTRTNSVTTMLFGDCELAMSYCVIAHAIAPEQWRPYLVCEDKTSPIKLNGVGVRYVGWKYDRDNDEEDTFETFHLHLERKVVEF